MAEAIAIDIAKSLLTKLGTAAFNEICSMYGVEDEVGKLNNTLSTIGAALGDADQRKEKSNLMKDWIRKLNDAVYDADDVLDAFATKALRRELNTDGKMKREVSEFFSSSNQLAFRYKLSHKIKQIRERFDEIAADMRNFSFTTERVIGGARVDYNGRETDSFPFKLEMIGRDNDKKEIIKRLMCISDKGENVSVLPIVGIGGLGKTTLTKLVYNEERVVNHFKPRLWVSVSEDFEKKSVFKKIFESITKDEVGNLSLDQLQTRLRKNLDGKRYLLILDDVWNENYEKWMPVKDLLMGGAKGSKIVVSTRKGTVASVMGTENPYLLKGLTEEQSWSLFEMVAFRGYAMVPPNLEVIGKEIIERCKGVPLAIRSLASVMQSKTQESQWKAIRNSDIWSLCQDDGDILPILKLSYDNLPMHLRKCFSYCSIFPKDYRIEKEVLIQLWMAQGYVQSSNGSPCLEDMGDQYFRILLSNSFFQDVELDNYNEVVSCKMHDLIHDLAVEVAESYCSILDTDEANISERVRHVSLVYPFNELPRQLRKAKGLRTFLYTCDYGWDMSSSINFMSSNFRCLRVLDVHNFEINNVPSSIDKLLHLRYIEFSRNNITSLPNSISKLINLQTLKLTNCGELTTLPEGITKLIRLRCVMTYGCWNLNLMPTGMERLTLLRRLNRFVVGGDKRSLALRELNGLNELRGDISIEGLENVRDVKSESKAANLIAKQYLQSLTLEWSVEKGGSKLEDEEEILLEGLQPHPELRELKIKGYSSKMFSSWMGMDSTVISLPNIVRITLEDCHRCQHLAGSLYQLPLLKFLKLRWMRSVKFIGDNNLGTKSSSSSSSSPLLSFVFFPSLEELDIEFLHNLKSWWRAAGTEEALLLSQRTSFPRLKKLYIDSCRKLTFMPMNPHLEILTLSSLCEKQLRPLLTTTAATMVTTSSSSCSIPSSFSSLSKLRSLRIESIKDLEFLPKEVLQDLNSLEHLRIKSCPRLLGVAVTERPEFTGLSSLRTLIISRCQSLTSLSGWIQHLAALQDLTIKRCENFDLSDDGMHWPGLRSLLKLQIENIPKLVSLPAGIQHVATLQTLQIWACPLLPERCRQETGEDWPNISHIPNIVIDEEVIRGTY